MCRRRKEGTKRRQHRTKARSEATEEHIALLLHFYTLLLLLRITNQPSLKGTVCCKSLARKL